MQLTLASACSYRCAESVAPKSSEISNEREAEPKRWARNLSKCTPVTGTPTVCVELHPKKVTSAEISLESQSATKVLITRRRFPRLMTELRQRLGRMSVTEIKGSPLCDELLVQMLQNLRRLNTGNTFGINRNYERRGLMR